MRNYKKKIYIISTRYYMSVHHITGSIKIFKINGLNDKLFRLSNVYFLLWKYIKTNNLLHSV